MTISTYMQLCLGHPTEGYYMNPNNPVFGMEGDFITSPEISQVFGEVCGEFEFSMTREMTNNSPIYVAHRNLASQPVDSCQPAKETTNR